VERGETGPGYFTSGDIDGSYVENKIKEEEEADVRPGHD